MFSTETLTAKLPFRIFESLQELSRAEGVTTTTVWIAAYQVLRHRYSEGEEDSNGIRPSSGSASEQAGAAQFFASADFSPELSFRALLRCVVSRLPENSGALPAGNFDSGTFFEMHLTLGDAPRPLSKLQAVDLRWPEVSSDAPGDLNLSLRSTAGEFVCTVDYAPDLFDAETIRRFIASLQTLLGAIAENPDRTIADLPILSADDRELLKRWNETLVDYDRTLCLHQLIEQQVERTPDAAGLVFESERLSYRELNARANQLAHRLRKLGVGPDVLVGVCAERSIEMVVALLGTMKAGGTYLPLDPEHPRERLAGEIEDTRPKVLLTQERFLSVLPDGTATICLDRDWQDIATESTDNPSCITTGNDQAYAIFTSGSTGKPKGVPNVHKGIVNRLLWMQHAYRLDPSDRVLQKTPYTFDVSVWEFFWPLMTGACLVVARPQGHKDANYLVDLIAREKITTMHFVPSMLRIFLEAPRVEECASLRRVICSGEALPYELTQLFFERLKTTELHNLYGPTEAAVDVTCFHCTPDNPRKMVPIGRPIWNTQIHILDRRLRPTPIGVPGELHIGGVNLARGYLNRPELTKEKFIPDPFSLEAGARLYKTGDLARFLPDGEIEYLGRLDHQVKLRGFRIELGEIESVLAQHPSVRQCLVVAREDEPELKRLVAYVIPAHPDKLNHHALREHLKRTLPDFMIPAAFVCLDAFPLSANGKIDRKALPAPDYAAALEDYVAPRSPMEGVVARIWAEVLRLPQVGINDDFFTVGGDSLLATQVISRIRTICGVELPLRSAFEAPTVAGLAARVESTKPGETEIPALKPVSRDQELSLSFAQQRMWFIDQFEPGNPFYNIAQGLRMHGELDRDALHKSLTEIVRRHEVLRTTYRTVEGRAVQVISPEPDVSIETIDLTDLPAQERDAEALRFAREEARRPFRLDQGPVMRASILRLSDDEHILILNTHHIASDGWSRELFIRELGELYAAFVEGKPSPLPPLPVQYADFAQWQRNWLQGGKLDRHLAYWRKQLEGAPAVLELPTDHPRPTTQSFRGDMRSIRIPIELRDGVRKLSQREGSTPYMVLLAAFQTLLHRYTAQEDVVIGSAIANRNHADIENLIGFFVNALVIRTRFSGNPTFRQLLRQVREVSLESYAHQDLPFEKLVEELDPERRLGASPLFQVLLVLQNAPNFKLDLPGLKLEWFDVHNGTSKFDLVYQIIERAEGLDCLMEFNTDLFEAETIERMLGHFRVMLEGIIANPDQRVGDLPILTAEEGRKLLVEFNDTGVSFAPGQCIHEVVEAQVERSPDSIALVFENQRLTYRELNARANQLAHFLRKNGVGPEVLVGMRLERSADMVIAIVGILKAGGAYLPFDIAYPADRLAFMIEDAKPAVVLTQEHLRDQLPAEGARIVCLDKDWSEIAQESSENPRSGVGPRNLAYVIYTSGSTGKPKGCLVTHYDAVRLFQASWKWFNFNERDVWTLFHSYAFDFSVWELWGALFYGGRVVVVPYAVSRSPEDFYWLLHSEGVTVLNQTPSAFRQVIQAEENVGVHQLALRLVILGGEALEMQSLKPWFKRHGDQVPRVVNGYGITETTVFVTFRTVSMSDTNGASVIGSPIPDMQLYLLDRNRQPVPIGVTGEIYVGGAGVARGYLNRPELTAQRYIADPFSDKPGARLYKSGDLARFLPNLDIEYLGRIDEQVKIRGFRIELGEIESALSLHPAVRRVVVLVREDTPGDKRLVAYVVPQADMHLSLAEARDHLRSTLPEYMVPTAIVEVESIPLTTNGKVDRRALPAPASFHPDAAGDYCAPEGQVEEAIARVFAELLNVERVGRNDNFFEIGGHSVAAVQALARLRAQGWSIPLRTIFESPCVKDLASVLQARRGPERGPEMPSITRLQKRHAVPLSIAQEALWYEYQIDPNSPVYNVPLLSRLRGNLDAAALEKALFALVERHELLRSAILSPGGTPVLVPLKKWRGNLQQADLRHLESAERELEAQRLIKQESERPFDLARDPLFRCLLIRLTQDEWILVHNSPHIVIDGSSLLVLYRELSALYTSFVEGRDADLPSLPFQFADFAVWQRRVLQGEYLNSLNQYWKKQLSGTPVVDLPSDFPRPAVHSYRGTRWFFAIAPDVLAAANTLFRNAGTTPFRGMYAVFNVFLHCYTGLEDICVGSPTAPINRACQGIEDVIGFFVNTVALRTDLTGNPSLKELIRREEQVVDGAMAHCDLPLVKVVEALQLKRDPSRPTLFQINFRALNQLFPALQFKEVAAEPAGYIDTGTSKFDLALEVETLSGRTCYFEYRTDLFREDTIRQMEHDFVELLRGLIARPDTPLSQVPEVAEISGRVRKIKAGSRYGRDVLVSEASR